MGLGFAAGEPLELRLIPLRVTLDQIQSFPFLINPNKSFSIPNKSAWDGPAPLLCEMPRAAFPGGNVGPKELPGLV